MTSVGMVAPSTTMSPLPMAKFQMRETAQAITSSSCAMAWPISFRLETGTPNFHAVVSPAGRKSDSIDWGEPVTGMSTVYVVLCPLPWGAWYWPLASNTAMSGARWFEVVWQLAQMAELMSWKSMRPPLTVAPMDSKGHGEV